MAWEDLDTELGELFAELTPNHHDTHAAGLAKTWRARRAASTKPRGPKRSWRAWSYSPAGLAYRARKAATKRIYTYEGGVETSCRSILRTT